MVAMSFYDTPDLKIGMGGRNSHEVTWRQLKSRNVQSLRIGRQESAGRLRCGGKDSDPTWMACEAIDV